MAHTTGSPADAPPPADAGKFRQDIQALRGLAILLVVLYHADLGVRAGYLGVDVFFVVSGYLITTLVSEGIERGTFSFRDFYFRRAKRLLPAAYVAFLLTGLAARFTLSPVEMRHFLAQLVGAVTFTGNLVLLRQTDYFWGGEAKPLLHVWSLAIEEQYYLVLPASLVLFRRSLWRPAAAVVTAASLLLCLAVVSSRPSATFYLPVTRAWELGIGTVGALGLEGSSRWARRLYWAAVLTLMAVPLFPMGKAHPGVDALAVCLATLVVILARHGRVAQGVAARVLARFGDISYSLYLLHWPPLALAYSVWLGAVPWLVKITVILASVLLAWGLYLTVEQPARQAKWRASLSTVLGASLASLVVVAVPFGLAPRDEVGRREFPREENLGLAPVCDIAGEYQAPAVCRTTPRPAVLVWGDSFAMHLVGGLVSTDRGLGIAQATRAMCGPLLDTRVVARVAPSHYGPAFAAACTQFNASVLRSIDESRGLSVVVLSTWLQHYVDGNGWQVLDTDGRRRPVDADVAVAGIGRTVRAIRALGRKVAFVAPPPSSGVDVGACLERRSLGLWTIDPTGDCSIDFQAYQRYQREALLVTRRIATELSVGVVGFDSVLCDTDSCRTRLGDVPLYRDPRHLTVSGSVVLGRKVDLMAAVLEAAR